MKIITLNIERNLHLENVKKFIESENPDILCLQEVMEPAFHNLCGTEKMYGSFTPFAILREWGETCDNEMMGVAILTREPHTLLGTHYYQGSKEHPKEFMKDMEVTMTTRRCSRAVLAVEYNGTVVATTHFTYSLQGVPDAA